MARCRRHKGGESRGSFGCLRDGYGYGNFALGDWGWVMIPLEYKSHTCAACAFCFLPVSQSWVSLSNINLQCFETVSPAHPSVQGTSSAGYTPVYRAKHHLLPRRNRRFPPYRVLYLCVHRTTVCRVLQRLQQTHKRIEHLFPEASDIERAPLCSQMTEYKANQIVFLDEPAANERTGDREMGLVAERATL